MEQATLLAPVTPPTRLHSVDRTWRFRVQGHPVPQGSFKALVSKTTGYAMLKMDNERELKAWREQVGLTAKALRPAWLREPLDGPVSLALVFIRRRPAGHFRSDGATLAARAPRYPDTKPDCDKLARAIGDALEGIAYVNDSRVVSLVVVKRFAERGEPEGVEVELTAL